jgi:hypothetical protein
MHRHLLSYYLAHLRGALLAFTGMAEALCGNFAAARKDLAAAANALRLKGTHNDALRLTSSLLSERACDLSGLHVDPSCNKPAHVQMWTAG